MYRRAFVLASLLAGCTIVDDGGLAGAGPGIVPGGIAGPSGGGPTPAAARSAAPGTPARPSAAPSAAAVASGDGAVWTDDGLDYWSMAPAPYAAPRATADRPDEVDGYMVHALYVLPADGQDHAHDTSGALGLDVARVNRWMKTQSRTQAFRFDTVGGKPDVTFVRLPATSARLLAAGEGVTDLLAEGLLEAGFDDRRKIYQVYYDGPVAEAVGAYGVTAHGFPITFLQEFPDGGSSYTAQHELLHALGAVPACAPHADGAGHLKEDTNDQMNTGSDEEEEAVPAPREGAGEEEWQEPELDPGRDDYYGHGRADCPDVARSLFLTPTAPGATPAPLRARVPAGGTPVAAPEDEDAELAITELRVVRGAKTVTIAGRIAPRAGAPWRFVGIEVGEDEDAYDLALRAGEPRAFAVEVPAMGKRQVAFTRKRGLAYAEDGWVVDRTLEVVDGRVVRPADDEE